MSNTNSLATGRREARYTKYETYTNNKGAWSRLWTSICNCEIKTLPPHGCKVLNDTQCPTHAKLIPTSIDFSQDGRPRLRANLPVPGELVQITGRAKGKMRTKQQNQRIPLYIYNFFRTHTTFQPYPQDINPDTGEKYEYSHLCLRPNCFEGTHITYESRPQNRDRERCFVDTCHKRASMGLSPHVPVCKMSPTDVMQTLADVRWYRQRQFPNWQKRGKKRKGSMIDGSDADEEEKTQSINDSDNELPIETKKKRKLADDDDSDVEIVASWIENPQLNDHTGDQPVLAVCSSTSVPAHPPISVSSGVPASR